MNKRTFNKNCRLLWGGIKKGEDRNLSDKVKHSMLLFLVSHRGPVHSDLITDLLDYPWVHCMGYLYRTKDFLHTGEHKFDNE